MPTVRRKKSRESTWRLVLPTWGRNVPGFRPVRARSNFGRRKRSPAGFWRRQWNKLHGGTFSMRPFSTGASVVILGMAVYGLFQGGHVAAWQADVQARFDVMLADAGFTVQEITLHGRQNTSRADLMAALNMDRGQALYALDLATAQERIQRLEWVAEAGVQRMWPYRVHVWIKERQPFALWQRGGRISLIDRSGQPITDEGLEAYAHLPLLVGHGAARKAEEVVDLLMEQPEIEARLHAAVRVGGRRWNLRLDNGVDIRLPEKDPAAALAEVAALDETYRILARDIKSVDLRLPNQLIIQMSADSAARRAALKSVDQRGQRRSRRGEDT